MIKLQLSLVAARKLPWFGFDQFEVRMHQIIDGFELSPWCTNTHTANSDCQLLMHKFSFPKGKCNQIPWSHISHALVHTRWVLVRTLSGQLLFAHVKGMSIYRPGECTSWDKWAGDRRQWIPPYKNRGSQSTASESRQVLPQVSELIPAANKFQKTLFSAKRKVFSTK